VIELTVIEAAQARIGDYVRRTPFMALDQLKSPLKGDARVTLKLESLQVTGSFKARGAMNRYLGVPAERAARGIVTASGGNHGLAVARTAFVAGVPANVFVPPTTSPAKIDKMRDWQASVEVVGATWNDANDAAHEFAGREGVEYFHPFADPLVVAGQGTLGLEILADLARLPELDAIVIAIGGGGLISGVSTALRALAPDIRIIGVEPEGSPTLKACLDAGQLVTLPEVTSKVATMSCARTEESVFNTVRNNVDEIVLVSDDDMEQAARWLWFEMGMSADLSGAASLAALRRHGSHFADLRHICALICGAGPEGATS